MTTTTVAAPILPMLTPDEVGKLLGVSVRQVQRLARAQKLPGAVYLGSALRFRVTEIRGFIEGKDNVFSAMRKQA